jgi:hypothetical protein
MKNKVYNLFEICNPKQWKTISIDNLDNNGKYPVYGANGIIGYYSEYNHEKPTLCITCRGATSGELNISTSYSYINGNTMALDDLDETKVDINFLYYYLKKRGFKDIISGSAQPQITRISLKKINIPLYTLNFQKKVASNLKKIEDIIKFKKNQLLNLTELVKSLFNSQIRPHIKELEIKKLGDIIEVKSSKRVFLNELSKNGVPFYRGTEIAKLSRNENVESNLFISEDLYQNLKKISDVPKIGDLLLPSICNNGEIWYVNKTNPFYFKDGRVLWLKLNKNINGKYLQYYLIEKFRQDYSKIASGTTFSELKIVTLKNLLLPTPPIELQNKFAERIEKIEKLKFEIEKSIEVAQNLYDSLISKYFDN